MTFKEFYAGQCIEEGKLGTTLATLGLAGSLLFPGTTDAEQKKATPTASIDAPARQESNIAFNFIKKEENSHSNKSGGWNEKQQKWFPHASAEGGLKTLAYGHKFATKEEQQVYEKKGISESDAVKLLSSDLSKAYASVTRKLQRKGYNLPSNEYAVAMLLDIEYNVSGGIDKYPKFVKAVLEKDVKGMLANYKRTAVIEGNRVEIGRSNHFKTDLLDPYIKQLKK